MTVLYIQFTQSSALLLEDTWQCLETHLRVMTEKGGVASIKWVEARGTDLYHTDPRITGTK